MLLGVQPRQDFSPYLTVAHAEEPTETESIIASLAPEFKLPFDGYITTKYSYFHPGVDLCTALGTPIHPVASGTVEEVNFGFLGYGNDIIITHSDGFKSLYAHMDKIYLKKGDPVTTESIMGTVGLTGFTSGPHTHLEIYKDGRSINPLTVLPEVSNLAQPQYFTPYGGTQSPVVTATPAPKVVETPKPIIPTINLNSPMTPIIPSTQNLSTPKLFSLPI